jgi:ankyrin repeat protein
MARLLVGAGANVNARGYTDSSGAGGHTPLFHALTHGGMTGEWLALTQFLLDHGADVNVRARVPGHYERPGELLDYTPLG